MARAKASWWILKANRTNPSDYEKSLEKEILYAKLEKAFKLPAAQKEIELFTSAFFMEDRLSVASVTLEPNEVNVNEEQIKTYWDAHKSNYLTKKSYLIALVVFNLVCFIDNDIIIGVCLEFLLFSSL